MQQLSINKFHNLGDMENNKLPKVTQEEIENQNRPITSKEIELVT